MNKKIILVASLVLLLAAGCGKAKTEQSSLQMQQQAQIQVEQTVEGIMQNQAFTFGESENKTALDMLKISTKAETQSFPNIGEYVVGINMVKPDEKHFWAFYVNGQQAQVGANSYVLKDGDKVEWKLEEIE